MPPVNPLSSFMRQPKIYIRLPSNGQYWKEGSLTATTTGEYPVYSMTARDELMIKIPDALLNGQAIVDVVQSCIPNIKNAWDTPNIDIDVILIAIRLATYGESMTTPITLGEYLEMEHVIDLRTVMDTLMNQIKWDAAVQISSDMTIFVRPLTYGEVSKAAVQTFETQKIMQLVDDVSVSDEDKLKLFKESFNKLTTATINVVADSIYRVDSTQGSTTNPAFIKEFVDNTDKFVFNKVYAHLDALRENNQIKPIEIAVTDEMRERGATEDTIKFPLVFDSSTFFV